MPEQTNAFILPVTYLLLRRTQHAPEKSKTKDGVSLRTSTSKSYEELPLFLNAKTIAEMLGISHASTYELLHEKDFPTLHIGNRIVVPKEAFIRWIENRTKSL